ncbi:hypothetical protein CFOL_v3_06238 [Cephalotus follicularis]|uniref:Uncharacterized protein n=1 Tax=Cephalotus follicularis TaxID=3775 RepID=A0A1Q3B4A9_CEPFO|nr:hypothetical protein CFOL_v3_06238 [Cephalotus follicularis]
MVELQAPENHLNGVGGVPLAVSTSKTVGSKRQRRPSVRLGDIGGQPYDSHVRKTTYTKQWKHHYQHQNHHHYNQPSNTTLSTKPPSKTKPLTTVTGGDFNEASFPLHEEEKDGNGLDTVAIGSWRVKDSKKRGAAKRIRSNWVSKMDETAGNNGDRDGDDNKFITGDDIDIDHDNDNDESYNREFDMENSEQSPIHSLENLGDGNERDGFYRRSIRDGGDMAE